MRLLVRTAGVAEVRVDTELFVGDVLDAVVERAGVRIGSAECASHRGNNDPRGFVGNERPRKEFLVLRHNKESANLRARRSWRHEEVAFRMHEAERFRPVIEGYSVGYEDALCESVLTSFP